jgi:predicted anti-sigma-YlaC factor YlaD
MRKIDQLRWWLQRVYKTQDEEIDCAQLYDTIAQFVDMQVSGQDAAQILPLVQQHLDQCPDCHDLYESLRTMAELEAEGRLDEIPSSVEELLIS